MILGKKGYYVTAGGHKIRGPFKTADQANKVLWKFRKGEAVGFNLSPQYFQMIYQKKSERRKRSL